MDEIKLSKEICRALAFAFFDQIVLDIQEEQNGKLEPMETVRAPPSESNKNIKRGGVKNE